MMSTFQKRFAQDTVDPNDTRDVIEALKEGFSRELELCRKFLHPLDWDYPGSFQLPDALCEINFHSYNQKSILDPVVMQVSTTFDFATIEARQMMALANKYIRRLVNSAGGEVTVDYVNGYKDNVEMKITTNIDSAKLLAALQKHQNETGQVAAKSSKIAKN